jgi:glutamate--cysteine ligase
LNPDAALTEDDVRRFAATQCFPEAESRAVGVELEWLVVDPADPLQTVPLARTREAARACGPLPGGGRITYEPGGQVEISSPPGSLPRCLDAARADVAALTGGLSAAGLELVGLGVDPARRGRRQLRLPRYEAMAHYFGPGPGRVMMCSTASVQVNVDAGAATGRAARWRLAHALGPMLVAAFAASPVLAGRVTGWRSSRQAVWAVLDPTRTGSAMGLAGDPVEAWSRYLLAARLMLVREGTRLLPVRDGSTLADWMAGSGPVARAPRLDDLAYHATTVFPPVRPKGWFELRYLDALPGDGWLVAAAVTAALLDDARAADAAAEACAPVEGRWLAAARHGLADPTLAAAARRCFTSALAALPRLRVGADVVTAVQDYADRYVDVGRCPADGLTALASADGPAALLRPVRVEALR